MVALKLGCWSTEEPFEISTSSFRGVSGSFDEGSKFWEGGHSCFESDLGGGEFGEVVGVDGTELGSGVEEDISDGFDLG